MDACSGALPAPTSDDRLLVAGLDIGGTRQSLALVRPDGRMVYHARHTSPPETTATALFEGICATLAAALAQAGAAGWQVAAVGVGFGGPVDVQSGVVRTSHHVPGWSGFPLRQALASRFGLPVALENDARAGSLGELHFGAGRGHRHMVYINIGTGIGGGLVLDGKLYRGATTTAGEIGHMRVLPNGPPCPCGGRGCLEALASGPSIARRARSAVAQDPVAGAALLRAAGGDVHGLTSHHVFAAAAQGDALAIRLVDETAEYLALAVTSLVNLLNPTVVVFGGGVSEVGEPLLRPVRERVRQWALPPAGSGVALVQARLGYNAGVIGAAALALELIGVLSIEPARSGLPECSDL